MLAAEELSAFGRRFNAAFGGSGSEDPRTQRRPERIAAGEAGDDFKAACGGGGSEDPRTQRRTEGKLATGGGRGA